MDNDPLKPKNSPAPALMLAFAPTAMVLMLVAAFLVQTKLKIKLPTFGVGALVLVSVASAFCCFTSSFMLFRRKTGLAIFGGILFLLLNGFIAFFFGCTAMLSGASF